MAAPSEGSRDELRKLLLTFVEGRDRSKQQVAKVEALLLRDFRGSEIYEELTGPVAAYEPAGGEYLYDEAALTKVFQEALATDLAP